MSAETDDLFRPTLTESDDAVGYDRPWNPWSLVVLTFFFGLPAGGGLLALNYQRLGVKARLVPTLAIVAAATVAILAAVTWLQGSGLIPTDKETQRLVRYGGRAAACLVAGAFAVQQRKRFRLFEVSGLPGGTLLGPGAAAVAVSIGVQAALVAAFRTVFGQ